MGTNDQRIPQTSFYRATTFLKVSENHLDGKSVENVDEAPSEEELEELTKR